MEETKKKGWSNSRTRTVYCQQTKGAGCFKMSAHRCSVEASEGVTGLSGDFSETVPGGCMGAGQ